MQENNEIDELILSGALEPAGIDTESGEMLYSFTNKLKDINPLLHKEVNNMFSSHMMKLWELGIVSMDVTSNNPIVELTEKAFEKDLIESLDEDINYTLKEIKRSLTRK